METETTETEQRKTLTIKPDTRKRLWQFKLNKNMKSMDELFNYLLDEEEKKSY